MELNHDAVNTPPVTAASLVVLRDGQQGLEVLLLKRHGASGVFGGVHVFPGGKVDAGDGDESAMSVLDQPPETLHRQLGEPALQPRDAAALYLAALREAFEECGLLLANMADATRLTQVAELVRQGHGFASALQSLKLQLHTRQVLPWSRWITPRVPSVSSKRFDTRFFLAEAPENQTARHDNHEATDSVWLTPRQGLERYWDGQIELAPPQIMSLVHLARYESVHEALDVARKRPPPVIQPEPFEELDTRVVCYPGDARHSVPERALPGPTRLFFRNRRFEPAGGLKDLLP
jgi:8-oxo-dGTP pyrophosphatase MutT (NUDIX family)